MKRLAMALILVSSVVLLWNSPALAEQPPLEVGSDLMLSLGLGDSGEVVLRDFRNQSLPGQQPQPVIPLIMFDEDGNLLLSEITVEDEAFLTTAGERCNGGTCSNGGQVLNCPTSGGPVCTEDEVCTCQCDSGATANICEPKKKTKAEVSP